MNGERSEPMGIYIHMPFCHRKCSYCDFFSLAGFSDNDLSYYVSALLKEIELLAIGDINERDITTVYFGGGTPTVFSPAQIEAVLNAVRQHFRVIPEAEISIEANPATLDYTKTRDLQMAGINRFSLGAQSFQPEELKVLNRLHDVKAIYDNVEVFHRLGISNFNMDLIYGIPGQTAELWDNTLQQALSCNPAHLSAYLLQLGDETLLAKLIKQGKVKLLGEDVEALMYDMLCTYMEEQGFEHYEISNFARPGFCCRHNMIYWQAYEYLGIGAGAVSYQRNRRYMNLPVLEDYLARLQTGQLPAIRELESMSSREKLSDAVILGLRCCKGVDVARYFQRFGFDIYEEYGTVIADLQNKQLLKLENGMLKLTKKGYFLSNEVLCQFIA